MPFWVVFCPFARWPSLQVPKSKFRKNEDIILHMCIPNDDHMINGSWDMKEKRLVLSSFYTSVPYMTTIWCMVPEICRMTDKMFCHFRPFFDLLPSKKNEKKKKKKKKCLETLSFCTTCAVTEICRASECNRWFSFWHIFCPSRLLPIAQKIKIWKKILKNA